MACDGFLQLRYDFYALSRIVTSNGYGNRDSKWWAYGLLACDGFTQLGYGIYAFSWIGIPLGLGIPDGSA
jgi:hypothetical protein